MINQFIATNIHTSQIQHNYDTCAKFVYCWEYGNENMEMWGFDAPEWAYSPENIGTGGDFDQIFVPWWGF